MNIIAFIIAFIVGGVSGYQLAAFIQFRANRRRWERDLDTAIDDWDKQH